jgi:hypothetical protein
LILVRFFINHPQAAPVRNKNIGGRGIRDNRELNIPALAGFCEEKFSVPKLSRSSFWL